jgi:pimeloyl-ACP methyl ester carboxylesterase
MRCSRWRAEWLALDATRQQALEALPLTDVPVVQITGAAGRKSSSHADDKVRFFEMWLSENMPHAKHIIAPHSAHAVSITDQQLVVEQLRKIIDRFR